MQTIKYKRVLLKLSGEALAGEAKRGLDFDVIGGVCDVVKQCVDIGVQIGIVVGGGNIWRGLKDGGDRMAAVVLIEADRKMLMGRLTSRRMCSNKACGAIYNVISQPPKKEGVCDKCGAALYQRSDDTEATAIDRLKVYEEQTAPLVNFYASKGQLVKITSRDVPAEENYRELAKVLGK